jgi:hypothetical protein
MRLISLALFPRGAILAQVAALAVPSGRGVPFTQRSDAGKVLADIEKELT